MLSKSNLKNKTYFGNIVKKIQYDRQFRKEHPDYFYPDGFVCFVGSQGSGKTLSAVEYVYNLLEFYPKCIIISNIELTDYPYDNERCFPFTEAIDLLKYKNGEYGVIFLIDEIHLYYGSQKGNNNLDPGVLQQICQQRKQRIHIVSTTQYYAQLNIALRRHFDSIILCKAKLFNFIQYNKVINKDSITDEDGSEQKLEGKVVHRYFFFRGPNLYSRYDTYKIIENDNLEVGKRSDYYVEL